MSKEKQGVIIGLVLFGTVLYAFNMGNVLFWDDADWITQNPCVQEPTIHWRCLLTDQVLAGIKQTSNYYRPFLMLTFAFNWALGGSVPWGYHLISNGLHIANAVLIFLLLSRFFKDERIGALVALFWLIHPLQTEAVAYISGRGDSLSVFLMLSAILLWLRADRWRLGALVCAVLAVLSRETAALLPLYLTIVFMAFPGVSSIEVQSFGFWRLLWRSLIASWPFFVISAVYGLLRLTVLNFDNTLNWYAESNAYTESILMRLWTFLQVLWEYVRLIVMPVGLHMERTVPVLTAPWQYPAFLGIILLGFAVWWVLRAWRRGNRIPFFGVTMFLIPLVPSSGILAPINSLMYEHWLYLSLLGAATLLAVYGVRLYDLMRSRARWVGAVFLALAVAYGVFLSVQTIRRNIIWGNPERLYLQILRYVPQNVRVLNNLANLYADDGRLSDAERYWRLAVDADPFQPAPYHNLGNLFRDRGDIETAIGWYHKAVEVSPAFWYSYQNLVAIYLSAGRASEAFPVLAAWQKADPSQPLTYYFMARILAADGQTVPARLVLESGMPAARAAGFEFERAYQEFAAQLR